MSVVFSDSNNSVFSLYIHIPYCISKCKYCDFFSKTSNEIPDSYIDSLCKQIIFYQKKYDFQKWNSIYIGGGTPSLLTENQLNQIFGAIDYFGRLDVSREITIEVNPDDVTTELIDFLNKSHVNRLSCGIQSFNEKSLNFVGRRADVITNKKAIVLIKEHWKGQISFDLICGLPEESEISFMNGLDYLIQSEPDHISMYSLTIEEETPLGQMVEKEELNYDFDFVDALWIKARQILEKNGYEQYEISNFAKPGYESQHNLIYWNHQNYIGCGSGATGTVYCEDGTGIRWNNTVNIHEYIDFWSKFDIAQNDSFSDKTDKIPAEFEDVDSENSVFEFFMMGLRKCEGITKSHFEKCFNQSLPEKFLNLFDKWVKLGFAEIDLLKKSDSAEICDDERYFLNKKGIMYLNRFLEELMN